MRKLFVLLFLCSTLFADRYVGVGGGTIPGTSFVPGVHVSYDWRQPNSIIGVDGYCGMMIIPVAYLGGHALLTTNTEAPIYAGGGLYGGTIQLEHNSLGAEGVLGMNVTENSSLQVNVQQPVAVFPYGSRDSYTPTASLTLSTKF